MLDLAGFYKELMNADNRAFVRMLEEAQEREKQALEAQADCQCNGGGFVYCEACHGK